MALAGIDGASFWRDEAATLSAARRPLPVLWHMLGKTDVVHGMYYLLMWPVVRAVGSSELAVRLPSALAVSAAAAGVAAIGGRLASERTGLASGLIFAILPVISRYGQEARSYAMVMALAVLAGYLLVMATSTTGSEAARRRWWIGYAIAVALAGWLNLMSLLLIPAHGMSLGAQRRPGRPDLRRWLAVVSVAGLAVLPLILLAWPQRHGTQRFLWLTTFGPVGSLPGNLTGSWTAVALVVPLAVLAGASRSYPRLTRLALPWLVLPPALLLAAGSLSPLYDPRYILFCVPALALITGAGLDQFLHRLTTWTAAATAAGWQLLGRLTDAGIWPVLACAVLVGAAGIPAQIADRAPAGHGDNIRLAATIVQRHARAGDAVLYQPKWWRQIESAYPYGFDRLVDISLASSPGEAGNFTGSQLPVAAVRHKLLHVRRVWLVEFNSFRPDPALDGRWRAVRRWRADTLVLVLYERRTGPRRPQTDSQADPD
jgi:mannosyltransferase